MTPYTDDDLKQGWEFKIVRSATGAFRKPAEFQKLVEQEQRAGWIMVEKFDSTRVRFKRPASARARDAALPPGVDPYRTEYGVSQTVVALWVIGGVLLSTLAIMGLVFALMGPR